MDDILDQIIHGLTVEDVYGEYGEFKKTGKSCVMRCPLHEENTPSFHIYPDLSFKCFGGCGQRGSAFKFIMKKLGVSFPEAKKMLAEKAGVQLSNKPQPYARLYAANKEAILFYEGCLAKHEEVMKYLIEKRQLTQESIARFHVGYAHTGGLVAHLKKKGFSEEEILLSGLAVKREGYLRDFFFRRVIFPIVKNGRPLGFSGRVLDDSLPKYLNTATTPVFQKKEILYGLDSEAIKEAGFANIVEGQVDVIMMHQHGLKNTVAPLGTAFSDEHLTTLKRVTNNAFVIYDGDKAGKTAAQRTVTILFEGQMSGRVAVLPDGEDPDSFLRTGKDLQSIIEAALPFAVFLIDRFKGVTNLVFNTLLLNGITMDILEFLAYRGTKQQVSMFQELQARRLLEKRLKRAGFVVSAEDYKVVKDEDTLIVLTKDGEFLLSEDITSDDYEIQGETLLKKVLDLKLKGRHIRSIKPPVSVT